MQTPKVTPTSTAISSHARQVGLVGASRLLCPTGSRPAIGTSR